MHILAMLIAPTNLNDLYCARVAADQGAKQAFQFDNF
jgi:hypothetical protein